MTYYFYPGSLHAASDKAWLWRVKGNRVYSKQLINVNITRGWIPA